VDQPAGTYRFRVTGYAATGPKARAPYEVTSEPFEVTASTALTLVRQADSLRWDVEHPVPDPRSNFRWRARHAVGAVVEGLLNGDPVAFAGSIVLDPGDVLQVAAGGIVDAFGNTNVEPISVSG
jgi:hypothetical protein